jgi:hypothetical protein
MTVLLPRINTIVAELIQLAGRRGAASNFQPVALNLTPECISVNAKKISGAQLISICSCKRGIYQRHLNFLEHALV